MSYKCPGQDKRFLKAEVITCGRCGYSVEIFSDETNTRCPHCKGTVQRQALPSCVHWCKAARECIGEDRWKKMVEGPDGAST